MPRQAITVTEAVRAGVTPAETTGDVAQGHTLENRDGRTVLIVRNSTAGPLNVTINFGQSIDGVLPTARVVAVPANANKFVIGPFTSVYNQSGTSTINIDTASASLFFSGLVI